MDATPNEKRCPLCGKENRCGAHTNSRCWCVDRVFPPELFQGLPATLKLKACVCPDCLDAYERAHPGATHRAPNAPAPLSLQTPRLWLREFTEDDAPFIRELLNEPSFLKNIGDRGVRTDADARAYVRDRLGASYRRHGFGLWRVALRTDNTAVGMCGLVQRDYLEVPDVGFAFLDQHAGRGYATESGLEVVRHARAGLGLTRVCGITSSENTGSQRVLTKLGLQYERPIRPPADVRELMLFASGPAATPDASALA